VTPERHLLWPQLGPIFLQRMVGAQTARHVLARGSFVSHALWGAVRGAVWAVPGVCDGVL